LAYERKLPLIGYAREMAKEAGMFLSYAPNAVASFNHAAYFVDRILKGEKPADLPVEQPTKFELIVNLKVARRLGINVPTSFLLLADEVIE
jgi:putative tryptophan/tyrosine transport system substrate-binding protein